MKNIVQGLRTLFSRNEKGAHFYDQQELSVESNQSQPEGDTQRQLYTALDIGTDFAKAIIFEVQDDQGVVLGVGRHKQSYAHMSDGIVTDIPTGCATRYTFG